MSGIPYIFSLWSTMHVNWECTTVGYLYTLIPLIFTPLLFLRTLSARFYVMLNILLKSRLIKLSFHCHRELKVEIVFHVFLRPGSPDSHFQSHNISSRVHNA